MDVFKRIYNYYISPRKRFTKRITSILGYIPANIEPFYTAFLHKSTDSSSNNERLEFLGDAILGAVIAEFLYDKYYGKDEGFMTKMRSKIVSRKTLNDVADKMRLDVLIRNINNTSIVSPSLKGNALEAFVGAIYLESGYKQTQKFIIANIVKKHLDINELEVIDDNYKSQLLEWGQKQKINVRFEVLTKYRVDNRDKFKIGLYVNNDMLAVGVDFNKKGAEQKAANKVVYMLPRLQEDLSKQHGVI